MMRWFRKQRAGALSQQEQITDLQRRMEVFEEAARLAGVPVESAAGDAIPAGVRASLIAASHTPRPGGEPVRLEAEGVPLIAVVGGAGDPRAWWKALPGLTHPSFAAPKGTVRVGRVVLPEGLRAVARGGTGTAVWVAEALPAAGQRQAAMTALKAARRCGWRTGVILPVAAFTGRMAWQGAKMAWQAVRAHAGAVMMGAGVAVAAPAMILALGAAHISRSPARPAPGPAATAPRHRTARAERVPPARYRSLAPGSALSGHSGHGPAPAGLGTHPPASPGQPSPSPQSSSPGLPVPSPSVTAKVTPPVPVPTTPVPVPSKTCIWLPLLKICAKT